ncbi:MAG: EamA family transporter, partial [Gemmatimonadales bacterium]|nr:EamA family transporter [Gemmatimonadales bacterium]
MTPEQAARHRLTLLLAFAAIYLIWGSTYLAIAFAIHTIPPLLMAGVRFLVAGGLLYAWARLRGAPRPRPVQWGWAFLLGALFFLVGNGAVVWVEQSIPSGLVALIVAMVSVWTALLEWLRPGGARPTGMVLVGIALGFAGVALLVLPGQGDAGHADPAGVALLMCSTFAWALASVLSRTADLPASATQVSGMEMLAGGVWLFGASLLHGDPRHFDPGLVTLKSGLSVLYLIVFGSLVTFTAFAWLLQ